MVSTVIRYPYSLSPELEACSLLLLSLSPDCQLTTRWDSAATTSQPDTAGALP